MNTDVLIVEDSTSLAQAYIEYLRNEPLVVSHVADGQSALEFIYNEKPRLVVLDLMLPDMNGMDILRAIHHDQLDLAVVMATGTGSYAESKAALELGARDFLEKPVSANRFVTTIKNALEHSELETIVEELETNKREEFEGFIGSSAPMQLVYKTIEQVASSQVSVFITGESGTGKEVCAKAIHDASERAGKPFIALNCAAIPHDLVESEIFGHVKGAFTGAVSNRDGAATQANGGTLFLDEIAEMDIDLQAKLLRFIQSQTFQRVGASKTEKVDVRFVCATNRNAFKEVEAGRFREDLYYRLNVISIEMPPLRKRPGDVLQIAQHFLKIFSKAEGKSIQSFDKKAQDALKKYHWPGNVRELQNVIRRISVMQKEKIVSYDMLQLKVQNIDLADSIRDIQQHSISAEEKSANEKSPQAVGNLMSQIRPLAVVERETIEQAIDLCSGNIPKAAALLDVSPSTIYRKIQHWQ